MRALVEGENEVNRALAKQAELLTEVRSRGVFSVSGYATVAVLLRRALRLSAAEAHRRAARAEALHPTVEGATVKPAVAPQTAAAFAAGEINPYHVDTIAEVMTAIRADVSDEDRNFGEQTLVDLARTETPLVVKRAGQRILEHLDPDGTQPTDKELARPERELRWSWGRDKRLRLTGSLDAESGHRLEALLSPLAKPRPAVDGERDPRSAAERNGDAFAELLEYAERAVERGTEAGDTPAVMVSMTLDQLNGSNRGQALMNWEDQISPAQARRIACDARILPIVLGGDSMPLDLGRGTRTATPHQRRALARRDGGCVMCARTPRWCQAHHLDEFVRDDGPTDLNNLALLCGPCHRLVHHGGWKVRMGADGRPECIPPPWLDPDQRPRRHAGPHQDPFAAAA